MNLRHAAALALVGWYLMLPLVRDGKIQNIPISEWGHVASFETADACESHKAEDVRSVIKIYSDLQNKPDVDATTKEKVKDQITASMYAECIATDDPRLKE